MLFPSTLLIRSHKVRLLASVFVAGALAITVAGCKTTQDETTGSIAAAPTGTPKSDAEWRQYASAWGERYHRNAADAEAAMHYARALRAIGERAQAVAVLRQASMHNPYDKALLGDYGRALAEVGDFEQALTVLSRAHTPDQPDWRILNAEGAVLDQMGRHQEAQRYYSNALKIKPNDPSVLSNLGLSYALSKDLKRAEATLRHALTQPEAGPKVRQNLALIVGLQGRFAEAEKIASADLPAEQATANVKYLRQMLAQRASGKKQSAAQPAANNS
ncbi:MAG TPA: tetratricopeptide repeat protein [Pseudolabrys sp.]|jgi:Flp pilus assembly protein TadD|nr:tetratricopeptide repeat protein [Pseudolabrys sp.]